MANLTGVSAQNAAVKATYESVKQGLPTVESIDTFSSSHPVAVAQLAIQYCNALVDDTSARTAYFPGFDFSAAPAAAFGARAGRSIVLDALIGRMMLHGLATDPKATDVRADLDSADHATCRPAAAVARPGVPRRSSRHRARPCSAAPSR